MSELDQLISNNHKTNRIIRKNERKIKKRNCVLLTTSILLLGSVFGVLVFFKNASNPNNVRSASIIGRAIHAKSMVNIDPDTDVYSVDNTAKQIIIPNETTFAELAEIMLLPWYEASLIAIEDDKGWDGTNTDGIITPSQVKEIRHVLLMTRDMLDVFGPVFPDTTSYGRTTRKKKSTSGKDKSLWRDLRKQYRDGYQLLGNLKDLDGLTYSNKLLNQRTNDVLVWKNTFLQFQKKNRIRRFLYTRDIQRGGGIDPYGCYPHKSSHLFWAETTKIPCGNDIGTVALQSLAKVQLIHSIDYLTIITNYTTVMPKSHELNFHNLRKELRIFLDEYNLFGTILMLGHINDKWTAYQIYIQDNSHKSKQKPLAIQTDKLWKKFLLWQDDKNLKNCITNILNRME
ncbi:hypothetical protein FRACYDRAFT_261069 [Fragilariopsis cylindrus CCMP1102]|uniref:Uncharacterized protein n=1 Tax=Fragilariopsis cylindrus CCMP1102 TaxID=635003 RepID=A0A1E7FK14_9STRA|nr:hypothetical protein FRACYDRAFT_261069 [Fragilariopsis cylindrus CCMP1102]|eukprot:OEU18123.1 hypothetical protein FRACYDRAFT_261069 [Fragilariopsis cylindrus CCMP1102]